MAPVNKTVNYETVITNISGEQKCWIIQNLGATHKAANYNDDTELAAGWYWQFNQKQGYKHSGTIRTPNSTWNSVINENTDWLSENDPCKNLLGDSWRLPNYNEMVNISNGWNNWTDPFYSVLKIHAAGTLNLYNGNLSGRSTHGGYWVSDQNSTLRAYQLFFINPPVYINHDLKASGKSVRCLKSPYEP